NLTGTAHHLSSLLLFLDGAYRNPLITQFPKAFRNVVYFFKTHFFHYFETLSAPSADGTIKQVLLVPVQLLYLFCKIRSIVINVLSACKVPFFIFFRCPYIQENNFFVAV